MTNDKPSFDTWTHSNLVKLTHELWDDNVRLREANEQLRQDLKDAMKLVRTNLTGDVK